jgi:hypothetical protein
MPLFLDRHQAHEITPEGVVALVTEDWRGLTSLGGVRAVGHWAGQAEVYCLLEAPDAAAISQYHAGKALRCSELQPVSAEWIDSTLKRPTTQSLLVSDLIRDLWR